MARVTDVGAGTIASVVGALAGDCAEADGAIAPLTRASAAARANEAGRIVGMEGGEQASGRVGCRGTYATVRRSIKLAAAAAVVVRRLVLE